MAAILAVGKIDQGRDTKITETLSKHLINAKKVNMMAGVILVRDVMVTDVKTARPDSSVREVVQKMNKFDVGSIIVVQERRPVGIITERDILRKILEPGLDPLAVKARQIMSSPIVAIREDMSLDEAARTMTKRRVKKLPVVRSGKLIGIVTATDLVKSSPQMVSLLEDLVWTRRP